MALCRRCVKISFVWFVQTEMWVYYIKSIYRAFDGIYFGAHTLFVGDCRGVANERQRIFEMKCRRAGQEQKSIRLALQMSIDSETISTFLLVSRQVATY